MATIYKLTFPDGKAYIGATTTDINLRLTKHKNASLNPKSIVASAIKAFGFHSVNVEILKVVDDELMHEIESKYILDQNTQFPNGYNSMLSCADIKIIKPISVPSVEIKVRESNFTSDIKSKFAERFKYVISNRMPGQKQVKVAEFLLVTQSFVNQVANAKRLPSTELLIDWCIALDISMDWLATGRGDAPFETKDAA